MSVQTHRQRGPAHVACAVLTVSDTRTADSDTSGRAIVELLQDAGHAVTNRQIVRDDIAAVVAAAAHAIDSAADALIVTGGTGITARDSTYEALVGLFEKRIDGFGELFRALSFQDIGPAAMLSRAIAGVVRGRVVFLLPGSEAAVRLAMSKLIVPELGHIVGELRRAD